MRYIDISKLRASITAEWAATAAALTGELSRAADKDERKNILNRPASADAWRDLKVYLEQISSNKCWYCESRQIRSDNAVDHFRPKGRVFECDDHPGYWWLAFNWENYRFSCTFCNSRRTDVITDATGGKHDHFPLAREDQRVYSDKEDIRRELPMLLDPVNPADYGLIWFEPDGRAVPSYTDAGQELFRDRAQCSIDLYHLNHTLLTESRLQLINYINTYIDQGDYYFRMSVTGDATAREGLKDVFKNLLDAIAESAEYSSAARATLVAASKKYRWIEHIL